MAEPPTAALVMRWQMKRAWEGSWKLRGLLDDGWEPWVLRPGVTEGRLTGTMVYLRRQVPVTA